MLHMAKDAGLNIDKLKAVQVAGTNGKGSTCAFLAAILQAAGFKTGLYTSPHLLDVRERIQVNGKKVSKNDFAALAAWAKPFVEKHGASYFETLTLMAFHHFRVERVDWAVVEVGLGGKKDATSILRPRLSIITHIALDHTDQLGKTVEQIAREKAGIISQNGVCLTTADGKAFKAIEEVATQKKAHLEKISSLQIVHENPLAVKVNRKTVRLSLQGCHQAENAALAVAAAKELERLGVEISDDAIEAGLHSAYWPCRMQKIGSVVIDGAHNPDGIRALVKALQAAHPGTRWNLVFGVLADKDYKTMVRELCKLRIAHVFVVTPKSPRALDSEKLAPLFKKEQTGAEICAASNIHDALKRSQDMPTLVCGSLYLAAEALQQSRKK